MRLRDIPAVLRTAAIGVAMAAAVAAHAAAQGAVPGNPNLVDLELVLAIDVSRSVDWEEANLQRGGYISAFSNPLLITAIQEGYYGRIAVTVFEWSSWGDTNVVAPWMIVGDMQSAGTLVNRLRETPVSFGQRTSISTAIEYGMALFRQNNVEGDRRVIDISGDGHNNHGRHINDAREEAVAAGITINGLPIINTNMGPGTPPLPDLDVYYKECVVGGPGSFVVVAEGFEKFAEAVTRKLILEVANLQPDGGMERFGDAKIHRAQFLQQRPIAPQNQAPLTYGPGCNVMQGGGGQQFPPGLFLPLPAPR